MLWPSTYLDCEFWRICTTVKEIMLREDHVLPLLSLFLVGSDFQVSGFYGPTRVVAVVVVAKGDGCKKIVSWHHNLINFCGIKWICWKNGALSPLLLCLVNVMFTASWNLLFDIFLLFSEGKGCVVVPWEIRGWMDGVNEEWLCRRRTDGQREWKYE